MNIVILGYGLEGRAAYEYWHEGNTVTICDQNDAVAVPEDAIAKLGPDYLEGLDRFDLIVRSPFIHPHQITEANNPEVLQKVTSNTNEFFRVCPSRNIIGITGTKGKGTTSTMTARMLEAAGKTVHLGGNIGVPALEMLKAGIQQEDWVVLELSSYQLLDLKQSPHIAACLMVVPEHLDWHSDLDEYYGAKGQLFSHQTSDDIAVFFANNENSISIAAASPGIHIPYFKDPGARVNNDAISIDGHEICKTDELKLLGRHNWQNVCAAVTIAWQVTHNAQALRSVATSFTGLPFRIEFRAEKSGVRYYNDSFATGPGSCMAAIESITEPKVMIMGGYERGLDLSELVATVNEHAADIRKILAIGVSGPRLMGELEKAGYTNVERCEAKNMPEIVSTARSLAQTGDAVVLSPGFASFDMFKNFEDRGNQFNAAVEAL